MSNWTEGLLFRLQSGAWSRPMRQLALPGPVAVIDVETTGLFPRRHDRIIEVAAIVIGEDGTIRDEFESLVNPGRDIGRTDIHQITAEDLIDAPPFEAIAPLLIQTLRGTVAFAAHNVRFDYDFLSAEYTRIGVSLPRLTPVCTMQLAGGGSLLECCEAFGIDPPQPAHNALADARAAAKLLLRLLRDVPDCAVSFSVARAAEWPSLPLNGARPVTRSAARARQKQTPTYLQRLLSLKSRTPEQQASGAALAYRALLDQVLEDRRIDDVEASALLETAAAWGLSGEQVARVHADYVDHLACAALSDGEVCASEYADLMLVARLLGQDQLTLEKALRDAAEKLSGLSIARATAGALRSKLAGKTVCFTGELQCLINDARVTREQAEQLATSAGLKVLPSVTKKLDLLVVADPQSGKAKKARAYGIRILHEPVFWREAGIRVD
jgi:DNA polymerase-3 subunit epsilon